jgi:hypothetical protein
MIFQHVALPSMIGFTLGELSDEEMKPIKDEIFKIQSNFDSAEPNNDKLIGHLKQEYKLTDCIEHLNTVLYPMIRGYNNEYNDFVSRYNVLSDNRPLVLSGAWVNFQKKHEFNPIHLHDGIFSFALWVKVPYLNADEMEIYPKIKNKAKTAAFNFHYLDGLGKQTTHTIPADNFFENKVVIFPAELSHSVNPFYTSDDYRISVSGNFKFQV